MSNNEIRELAGHALPVALAASLFAGCGRIEATLHETERARVISKVHELETKTMCLGYDPIEEELVMKSCKIPERHYVTLRCRHGATSKVDNKSLYEKTSEGQEVSVQYDVRIWAYKNKGMMERRTEVSHRFGEVKQEDVVIK